ncbi:MAG: protein kinase, partial [Myxococcota bacterium]|nr:protein kinase [Myxococcota bacterium]
MELFRGDEVGPYVVDSTLGAGGMATVYRVKHKVLNTQHALKILHEHYSKRQHFRDRFLEEARIQARLRHKGLMRVTDILSEEGTAGMVMDYLVGETLEDHLDRMKQVSVETAVKWTGETL